MQHSVRFSAPSFERLFVRLDGLPTDWLLWRLVCFCAPHGQNTSGSSLVLSRTYRLRCAEHLTK